MLHMQQRIQKINHFKSSDYDEKTPEDVLERELFQYAIDVAGESVAWKNEYEIKYIIQWLISHTFNVPDCFAVNRIDRGVYNFVDDDSLLILFIVDKSPILLMGNFFFSSMFLRYWMLSLIIDFHTSFSSTLLHEYLMNVCSFRSRFEYKHNITTFFTISLSCCGIIFESARI